MYPVLNLAFWLSWVIVGLREEWLAPWPLVPAVGWGVFILYRVYRLRKTISRLGRLPSATRLRIGRSAHSAVREIIDARKEGAEEIIDLREPSGERVSVRNVVRPAKADDAAEA